MRYAPASNRSALLGGLAVAQRQSAPGRPIGWIKPKRASDWLEQQELQFKRVRRPAAPQLPFRLHTPVLVPALLGWPRKTATQLLPALPPFEKEPSPAGAPPGALWVRGEWCGGHPGALGHMRGTGNEGNGRLTALPGSSHRLPCERWA